MIPSDMLPLRNKVEDALKTIGFKMNRAGVSLVEPEADLSGVLDGQSIGVTIRLWDKTYENQGD